jgi:hypothetical protein
MAGSVARSRRASPRSAGTRPSAPAGRGRRAASRSGMRAATRVVRARLEDAAAISRAHLWSIRERCRSAYTLEQITAWTASRVPRGYPER